MDPNANLDELRAFAKRVNAGNKSTSELILDARCLAELFTALDEWITEKGGFLPDAWSITRDGRHL